MFFLSASLRQRTSVRSLVKTTFVDLRSAWLSTSQRCFHTNPVRRQYGPGPVPKVVLSNRAARVESQIAQRTHITQTLRSLLTISYLRPTFSSYRRRSYCTFESMAPTATATSKVSPDEHRLPLEVKPKHYDVTLRTDLEKLVFDGSVSIE